MNKIKISGQWQLYCFEQYERESVNPGDLDGRSSIPCTVPGNVELELIKQGILPEDIYMGQNIRLTEDYEKYEWWYETKITMPEIKGKAYLYFEGVDTLAQYWLDGEKIGESENMLIPVKIPINNPVPGKTYTLHVRLRSPIIESGKIPFDMLSCVRSWQATIDESLPIRKARHSYGWDIMPRAVSAGIWKDAYIVDEGNYDFNQLAYFTKNFANMERHATMITFFYEMNDLPEKGTEIEIHGVCGESEFYCRRPVNFKARAEDIVIENPKLWWPKGYGEPNLYKTTVRMLNGGEVMSERTLNVGIRKAELKRTDTTDGKNGYFGFIINNVPVTAYGTNWVPLDAFHSREHDRYDKALEMLDDIGCNIVRWWGGNVYPEQKFYDFCDSHGIMVWQDFAMACGTYPQDDEFAEKMKKEVEAVVRLYRNHPSLVLWAGDNECDQMTWQFTGEKENRLTREFLPEIIARNDQLRSYLPSSPYIAKGHFDNEISERHLWGPRDFYKADYYKNTPAHFASELGYHACPSPKSVKKFISPDQVWGDINNSADWILHSSDQGGNNSRMKLMGQQIKQLFGCEPKTLEEFSFASQISQAEANKFYIELFRCNKPVKTGLIWWNLIDGWPQFSDAVVDWYYDKKIAYYYIKRVQQPVCVMVSEMEWWHHNIVITNDTLKEVNVKYKVTDADTKEILAEGICRIPANGIEKADSISLYYSDKKMLLIDYEVDGKAYKNHYLCGLPPFSLEQYHKWYDMLEINK